jgi:hypothetical protein
MPVNSENNVTRVSFVEHVLVIPKTSNPNRDEFGAERLDIQTRSIELLECANNYLADKIAVEK